MPMTKYMREKVVDHAFRNTIWTPPATVWVGLHTGDPTVEGLSNTEVVAAWYGRIQCAFVAQTIMGQTSNQFTLTYNPVTGSGVTITHVAIWTASTGGNIMEYAQLSAPKTYAVSDVPSWLAGTLSIIGT